MSFDYASAGVRKTPQSQPIPGTNQVKNNAGGYTFQISPEDQFKRFLILGSAGGSYYQSAQETTAESTNLLLAIFNGEDAGLAQRCASAAAEVSVQGRAPKMSSVLYALAAASISKHQMARNIVLKGFPNFVRTGTHLFEFLQYRKALGGGWGRGLKKAVADWYLSKSPDQLAYQVLKYRQRNGWTHRDVLRLAHVKPNTSGHTAVLSYAVHGEIIGEPMIVANMPLIIKNFVAAHKGVERASWPDFTSLGLSREMIPTEWLQDKEVWRALNHDNRMPITALIRNLGKMTDIGYLKPLNDETLSVCQEQIANEQRIKKGRVHPITVLTALKQYAGGGQYGKGSLSWDPVPEVINALDQAVAHSFESVERIDQKILVGVDVSGSMGHHWRGDSILTAREAAAGVATLIARMAKQSFIHGFSGSFVDLGITSSSTYADVMRRTDGLPFSHTDCALPMRYATQKRLDVDTFVVITDNETWHGAEHPVQALEGYRRAMNKDARLIVLATEATPFSIADPNDPGMLDIAGFDSAVPRLIESFIKREF